MSRPRKTFLISLVLYCVLVKVMPWVLMHFGLNITSDRTYPWSFTPVFAVGIFGVGMFRDVRKGFGYPVLAWVIADVIIGGLCMLRYGFDEGLRYAVYPGQIVSYASLLLAISAGYLVRSRRNWPTILTASLLGPTVFFLVSNFGVWLFDTQIGYSRDLNGLWQAYVAGLLFYRNQLISTVAFSGLLFSRLGVSQLETEEVAAPVEAEPLAAER